MLRLPRNLQDVTKSRSSDIAIRKNTQRDTSEVLRLPRKMTMEVSKVLRLSRKLQRIFWKRRKSIGPGARHTKRLSIRLQTRENVRKRHACHAKRHFDRQRGRRWLSFRRRNVRGWTCCRWQRRGRLLGCQWKKLRSVAVVFNLNKNKALIVFFRRRRRPCFLPSFGFGLFPASGRDIDFRKGLRSVPTAHVAEFGPDRPQVLSTSSSSIWLGCSGISPGGLLPEEAAFGWGGICGGAFLGAPAASADRGAPPIFEKSGGAFRGRGCAPSFEKSGGAFRGRGCAPGAVLGAAFGGVDGRSNWERAQLYCSCVACLA